jgi:hypothetical protein
MKKPLPAMERGFAVLFPAPTRGEVRGEVRGEGRAYG